MRSVSRVKFAEPEMQEISFCSSLNLIHRIIHTNIKCAFYPVMFRFLKENKSNYFL